MTATIYAVFCDNALKLNKSFRSVGKTVRTFKSAKPITTISQVQHPKYAVTATTSGHDVSHYGPYHGIKWHVKGTKRHAVNRVYHTQQSVDTHKRRVVIVSV
mmetsp:Transcript_21935/g.50624  ORF Transcript_21935/g.50624 Transcript_21935/m.50624 type:complete len:102 (-) Transcript_21935:603-908(-)